jgi:hypothetical protein
MATEGLDSVELTERDLEQYQDELGFLLLGLAQMVSIFAIWFGVWPEQFGFPAALGYGFAAFFLLSGVFGFYLAFRSLTV